MSEPAAGDPVVALFDRVVDLPPHERPAFLDAACRGDAALRAEVEGLLAYDERTPPRGKLLDDPPLRRDSSDAAAERPALGQPVAPGEIGTLGPYRVVRPLGQGGMGVVYAAVDTRLDRRVALKVMLPRFAADTAAKARFLREARAAAQVDHDNVVTVHEADERDGVPYIAMQLLEGCTLDEEVRQNGAPPLPEILRIAREAADGLAAAHAIGLVHRDVKPSNLWLQAPNGRVKVLDFGLAKPLDTRIGVTQNGAVIGTPAYMSPEQARGERLDHRTDLFSLGGVLYRLCGGRLPFDGPSTMAVLMRLGTEEPPPLRELNPSVPAPLAELIHQMLAKRPESRPRSAAEVAVRLRAMIGGTSVPDLSSGQRLRLARRRRPSLVAAVAALLLAVVAIGAVLFVRNPRQTINHLPVAEIVGSDGAAAIDPDRHAAEWALRVGGNVDIDGREGSVSDIADLPKDRFTLTAISVVYQPAVTDASLENIRGLKGLKRINLGGTSVTDEGLVHLKEHEGLNNVVLERLPLTKSGLAHLRDLRELRMLNLGEVPLADDWLPELMVHKALTELVLSNPRLTEEGLARLKHFKGLTVLHLLGSAVTDETVEHFKELELTSLNLAETKLTDTGLARLKHFKRLRSLSLAKTAVTAKGLADFHAALPRCRIYHDGGTIDPVDE